MRIALRNINNPDNTLTATVYAEMPSFQLGLLHLEDGELLLPQLIMPSAIEPYVEEWFTLENHTTVTVSIVFDVRSISL